MNDFVTKLEIVMYILLLLVELMLRANIEYYNLIVRTSRNAHMSNHLMPFFMGLTMHFMWFSK